MNYCCLGTRGCALTEHNGGPCATSIGKLLAQGVEAAADPANVAPFHTEVGLCLRVTIAPSMYLYVPVGGAYFMNGTLGPVFTDARALWDTAAFTWNRNSAEPTASDTLLAVRRLAEEGRLATASPASKP